ncbi:hypothetical protein QFC22_000173 [Naganishia vaughanmartiniae]|uniref:Uncharacterized protein n=1 Tax=Naganishia vaughanmartiniae TaxID=1424756 RepID=A0ACC2XPD1_9TREE|nr:hypothetical protein QFC22_000173 [Naganishia vaughanmartiniae]
MDPRLTKQFVSPLISKTRKPTAQNVSASRSFASPFAGATPSFKRKLEDYVSDSGEEDDVDLGFDATQAVGMEDDPLVRVVHKSHYSEATLSFNRRPTSSAAQKAPADESYWIVQWRKPQQKKHKTWDGDGILVVRGNRCILKDTDGKDIASAALKDSNLSAGDELRVAGKEIEIDRSIPAREYLDGSCFGYSTLPTVQPSSTSATMQPYRPLKPTMRQPVPAASFFSPPAPSKSESPAPKRPMSGIGLSVGKKTNPSEPRYNPDAPGAIVMKRPSKSHAARFNKRNLPIVDVVVDPVLGALLRPHQREGVKFMYECVMGMKRVEATGCILADEMGLGKTLQTITLVHTLLQQNPYGGPSIGGVAGKVLIVTPVSLVQNWKKEFHKWLGKNRIGVFVGDKEKNDIKHFAMSKSHQVLLIGYEKLRTVIDVIKTCSPPIGLVICDEGHRLKSKDNKTTKMFDQLGTKRRIILSGTPLQNDLGEFWAMSDFACPGLLDTYSTFVKLYEKPILKSRAPNCTPKDQEIGKARMAKLAEITAQYVLRRTADIIADVLPPKHEYVVFIAPTSLQLSMFAKLLHPKALQAFIRGPTAQCLGLINHLKQICNYPPLLLRKEDNSTNTAIADINAAVQLLPQNQVGLSPELSGKMLVLEKFLKALFRDTEEKIVLVSNYTSTLDVLEKLCRRKRYKYLRLDGSTAQKNRQEFVDKFNRSDKHQAFVFLLSAKAGGVGLNLIGGSRLILFDSDWNPSTDLQAMARIHRDGQKHPVHIYRFVTTGTIEEKIYQRQVTKMGLSDQLIDHAQTSSKADGGDSFSAAELKDLFTVQCKTNGCATHDLLECDCLTRPDREDADEEPAVSSLPTSVDIMNKHKDDEDSDEEQTPAAKFVAASQYDPAGNKKEQRQAALAKQAKLAALRKWTHIDPNMEEVRLELEDKILNGLLSFDLASRQMSPINARSDLDTHEKKRQVEAIGGDEVDSGDEFALAPQMAEVLEKARRPLAKVLADAAAAESAAASAANNSADESMLGTDEWPASDIDDEDGGVPDSADEMDVRAETREGPTSPGQDDSKNDPSFESPVTGADDVPFEDNDGDGNGSGAIDVGLTGKKYDLNDIARAGQAGKIMFIFQKVSNGNRMDKPAA